MPHGHDTKQPAASLTEWEIDALVREQARTSKLGTQRDDTDVVNYWQRPGTPLRFGNEEFRLLALRGAAAPLKLDGVAEAVEWEDSSPILTGSLTVRHAKFADFTGAGGYDEYDEKVGRTRPHRLVRPGFDLGIGHQIICQVAPYGKIVPGNLAPNQRVFKELWMMRITKPSTNIKDDQATYELGSDLVYLAGSKDDWKFTKANAKNKKLGWKPEDIVRSVCHRYGVKVGALAKTKSYITSLVEKDTSPLDIITKAYEQEKKTTGRRFVVGFRGRWLTITHLQRSKSMLLLGDSLVDATLEEAMQKGFATSLDVTANVGEGAGKKKRRKINFTLNSPARIKRYGYIRGKLTLDADATDEVQARKLALRQIASMATTDKTLTFTHPGIPSLKRGDAMKVDIPYGNVNKKIVFVQGVHHTVAPGSYEMEVTVQFDDPYLDADLAEAQGKLCAVAHGKGRKQPDFCKDLSGGSDKTQTDQSNQRADATDPTATDPTAATP